MAATPPQRRALAKRLSGTPSRFAAVEGLRVHYKQVGTGGPVLLFVHGWACDHSFWRHQAERFAERATMVFVDLPGHGRSEKPQVPYTHDRLALALEAVLDDAGHPRAVLVGHSAGGSVVRHFHRRSRGRAQALVLVDASLRPFWKDPAHLGELVAHLRAPDYLKTALALVEMMLGAHTPLVAGIEIRLRMLTTPQHVMVSVLEQMADPALWAEEPLDLPVQALLARASKFSADDEAWLRRLAPRLDLRWLDGVGHFMMLTQPEVLNAALGEFLAAQGLL